MNLFKKISYPLVLVAFLGFIVAMSFGAIVKYHYEGGQKYQFLQKPVMLIAEVPINIKLMINNKTFNLNKILNKPSELSKHKDKKRFERFIENKRNALLVLPRYDQSISRSVVDIIDFNNFEVLHTYKHDIDAMNAQVTNTEEFPRLKTDASPIRFEYRHPLLLEDGSLISTYVYGPAYKIDFCSNLQWINDEEIFHHSQMLDYEGNIWVGGQMNPKSHYVKKYSIEDFLDDSIIKININGKILFNKSVIEILIENNIFLDNFASISSLSNNLDPIHLNDIEPTFSDTEYWKQGDVFLSLRHQSAIIHYRPSTNKVINYITGPFSQQHDVDIITDEEISIFNNNNYFVDNDEYSEVVIYNFETKKFRKLFNDQLQKENFKTGSQGLSVILKDGSLMVEETNHGRIILFNNKGEKEWEFLNKDKNGDIGIVSWIRVIENESFIENFKTTVKNKSCLN